ncbi:MAG: tetratricopeptide repeat protein [Acidobacteria bacterium]|nr:tetratricopeptide repeat protein [Acidobacteriota bacterium]
MLKTCPTCGADIQANARFCRRCGMPARSGDGTQDTVSPQAATAPLTDEGRTTDGLAADDPRRTVADTTRVNQADLERLLREQSPAPGRAADPEETLLQTERDTHIENSPRADNAVNNALDTGELQQPAAASDDFGMMTRPVFKHEPDEEVTITVPRVARPFDGSQSPAPVELTPTRGATPSSESATAGVSTTLPHAPPSVPPTVARRRRAWPFVLAACVGLLALAVVAGWLVATRWRSPSPTDASSVPPVAPPDAKQLFEQKMSEAAALLAAGDAEAATARLREANGLDPSNTRAHQRLGEIFLENGRRREAIEEFRVVTQNNPNDFAAWRSLASAQLAENLYGDAAESYRHLLALVGDASADSNDLLAYADALRQSGRADEARAVYQRLTSAPAADVAGLARQRLAELTQPTPTPTPKPNETASERAAREREQNPTALPNISATPQPTQPPAPTPAPTQPPARVTELTPAEHYQRGVELWRANRGAAVREFLSAAQSGNPDAYYYLGLNLVEGKDIHNLKRAEVVAALGYFQNAQRGQFASQSRRYTQQLEQEFDRLRKQ